MDRGAWRATIHGAARVGHDLATKPPPPWNQGLERGLGQMKLKNTESFAFLFSRSEIISISLFIQININLPNTCTVILKSSQ